MCGVVLNIMAMRASGFGDGCHHEEFIDLNSRFANEQVVCMYFSPNTDDVLVLTREE